jgi:hypothetical protein
MARTEDFYGAMLAVPRNRQHRRGFLSIEVILEERVGRKLQKIGLAIKLVE